MKIVINVCYGGFGLSDKAIEKYLEYEYGRFTKEGRDYYIGDFRNGDYFSEYDILRDNLNLIKVVEELKEDANGMFAKLKIVEIPDDVTWDISEYDGWETIHEIHRIWS